MNRRDLLRGAIAGLLGSAVAVPLLEGPALSAEPTPAERDGYVRVERRGKFIGWAREETPNHEPVNIHRDENILSRRGVVALEIRDDLRVYQQQLSSIGPLSARAAADMALTIRRQLRKVASKHRSRS